MNGNPTVPTDVVEAAFLQACDTWSSAINGGLTFVKVDSGADVRVAWFRDHHGSAPDIAFDGLGKQLAHAWGRPSEFAGEIHLDLADRWSSDLPATGNADLCTQLTHELGHVLGLGHSLAQASIMYPTFAAGEVRRVLSESDRTAVRALYP